jgi:hypothetical protein
MNVARHVLWYGESEAYAELSTEAKKELVTRGQKRPAEAPKPAKLAKA